MKKMYVKQFCMTYIFTDTCQLSISSEETYAVKHNNTMYICYIKVLKLRELKFSTLM